MSEGSKTAPTLNIALWAAQIMLALAFGLFGFIKATRALSAIAADGVKWVVDAGFPPLFVRGLGMLEMLGAIGIVLPALTRIKPGLVVVTAVCFFTLQVLAIGFHLSRGEASVLGLNAVLIGLAAFVLWGRSRKVVIVPRG